jgi:ATP synthase protein I
MRVEQLARRLLIAQVVLTVVLGLAWAIYADYSDGLAVIYGGAVSILLGWLHKRGVRKAEVEAISDAKAGMLILYIGAVIRFILLMVMLGVGFGLIKLSPQPMLAGFVLAQLGFLLLARR